MKPKSLPVINAESVLAPAGHAIRYRNYGSDVIFTESVLDPGIIDYTRRFDVTTVFVCLSGRIRCKVDLETYVIERNTVFIVFPGQIVAIEESEHARGYAMMISSSFINEIKLEKMKRMNFDVYVGGSPMCRLEDEDIEVFKSFFLLGRSIIDEAGEDMRHVAEGVTVAYCNTVISYMKACSSKQPVVKAKAAPNHSQIFERFIDLLSEHHAEHHSLNYYAARLSISLKYLSLVVKECSGRTVQDWINEYLVLLAKSLLANSELSVNSVALSLHFKNQSAFGKYFKKHVGMGPRQYRKSLK